jgi:hypothetical protein
MMGELVANNWTVKDDVSAFIPVNKSMMLPADL